MIIMAQHPQHQQQLQIRQKQQAANVKTLADIQQPTILKANTTATTNNNQQQQPEQDGKRTLIKNQLYLIEQLQLENANLRNERDQLQLENEELKFQLQMISSSNILLNQPGATFKSQQLERLVETSNEKINGDNDLSTNLKAILTATPTPTTTPTTALIPNQVKLLATPTRQPMKLNGGGGGELQSATATGLQLPVRTPASFANDGKRLASANESPIQSNKPCNKLLSGKSTSLSAFNVKSVSTALLSRNLPHDDEEQRIKLVEQRYGDRDQVQAAAIIIQRAFRKYQICKRFRTITEQLRHTCQSVSQPERKRDTLKPLLVPLNNQKNISEQNYASGATRAATWESLSYAASRLAASAAASTATSNVTKQSPINDLSKSLNQQVGLTTNPISVSSQQVRYNSSSDNRQSKQQDPVVVAALNFQQLESIRKRQYRVGLNIFNKNPEKGVSFLVAHSFIDSSSPYTKSSTSYYHSNQLHFMDKHYLVQQQQAQPTILQSCQVCCEEDNLKRNIAHFLLHRKGLAKEKIGQYLGNIQAQFNQDVLKHYLQELDFYGLQIDLALRKFLSTFRLPGEAQKIERIVDCFAQRFVQCQQQQQQQQLTGNVTNTNVAQIQLHHQPSQQNLIQQQLNQNQGNQNVPNNNKNNLILLSKDEIFILTFAIIMLNTDLHSPSLKPTSRMSASQFVNNLRGVFKSRSINESDLIEIYERVKANQITTTPDHVTHVMKVQQGLTVTNFQRKELPNLCVPHRRLVCFCRLFEVYDVNKKERVGQHQREIFLFNDLLLITKLARRVRANTTQLYSYRQSISLQGLYAQLFQSAHYNFGIRLCQRSNDETLIMFNARNELDQSRFVDDLGESIAEMDEMETIKAHNIIETIHFKYLDRLRRHALMHSASENVQQTINGAEDDNQQQANKMLNMMKSCDNRTNNTKQILADDDKQSENYAPSASNNLTYDGRVKAKFSSMLNLSTVVDGKSDNGNENVKSLRQNQSFVQQQQQQQQQRSVEPRGDRSDRRCSTSSVHSLDSGLFLSRDVSPNQSS